MKFRSSEVEEWWINSQQLRGCSQNWSSGFLVGRSMKRIILPFPHRKTHQVRIQTFRELLQRQVGLGCVRRLLVGFDQIEIAANDDVFEGTFAQIHQFEDRF